MEAEFSSWRNRLVMHLSQPCCKFDRIRRLLSDLPVVCKHKIALFMLMFLPGPWFWCDGWQDVVDGFHGLEFALTHGSHRWSLRDLTFLSTSEENNSPRANLENHHALRKYFFVAPPGNSAMILAHCPHKDIP